MGFLIKTTIYIILSGFLMTVPLAAQSVEGAVLRDGLDVELVYDGSEEGSGALVIGAPTQIAIDPQTGELYLGNAFPSGDNYTLVINPNTGEARRFPFFGNGMAFNKSGNTFYFGLSNLMLGVWYRDIDEIRKFTILPGVESVQILDDGSANGQLLVANSDYGKNILGVDTVWEVDQGTGIYTPIMRFSEGSLQTGVGFAALDAMGVTSSGRIYALTGQGKILIRNPDGTYQEGNSSPVTNSGLMQGGLGGGTDGLVYHQDTSSAEVFAYFPDGRQVLVAYGTPWSQANALTDGGIASDGQFIYNVTSQGKIYRIFSTDGAPLAQVLSRDLGSAVVDGIVTDSTGIPLPGVRVRTRDKSIDPVITGEDGRFSMNVPAGLYHLQATLSNFEDFNLRVVAQPQQPTDLALAMISYLPGFLAPGLEADIVATKSADSIEGSSDVTLDNDGNVYSLNHSNGTITKTILDPETGAVVDTFIAVRGGGLDNAWFIAVGDDFNMYSSSSNSGLLRLPAVNAEEEQLLLTVDPNDERVVRDQFGVDRMVSYVTDIDGATVLSNGDIMFSSGSGGSIVDGFPEGTIDTIIRYNPSSGQQTLFSRGNPAGNNSVSFFNNPDIVKVDGQDRLLVTNRGGNVVRVNQDGSAELIWPGDGEGYPEGLSSYTCVNSDKQGHIFLKGVDLEGDSVLRMIDPNDPKRLIVAAKKLSPASGFGGYEFDANATSVYLSEWDFVLRIRAVDGRTIAENLLDPPSDKTVVPTKPRPRLRANPLSKAAYIPIPQQVRPRGLR